MEFAVVCLLSCNIVLFFVVARLLKTRVSRTDFDRLVLKIGRSWFNLNDEVRLAKSRIYNLEHPRRSAR